MPHLATVDKAAPLHLATPLFWVEFSSPQQHRFVVGVVGAETIGLPGGHMEENAMKKRLQQPAPSG